MLLRRLPKTIIEIRSLVELTISNCNLASPPQEIAMRNIREIKGYFEKLVTAEHTGDLEMTAYSLYEIPPDIPELESLDKLTLSGNYLRTLPDDFGRLTKLKELILDQNSISVLPDCIRLCTSLETLVLTSNEVKDISEAVASLPRLRTLLLDDNRLRSIPPHVSRLTSLVVLNLDANKIKAIPDELGRLTDLEELHLSRNPFQQPFPRAMCQMVGLKKLMSHESRFTVFPAEFAFLSNITDLSWEDSAVKVASHPRDVCRVWV